MYPITVVWSEARIVRQREVQAAQRDAAILQTVIGSVFSKEGGEALKELMKKIEDVG